MIKKSTSGIMVGALVLGFVGGGLGAQVFDVDEDGVQDSLQRTTIVVEESDYIDAIEEVSPSVVSVVASKEFERYVSPFPFLFPFEEEDLEDSGESELFEIGGGSGFVVSSDGLIITNKHVVSDDEAEYTVVLNNGDTLYADVLSRDPVHDIAALQIYTDEARTSKPSDLKPVTIGDSDELEIGSRVLAIGNALAEFENTTTAGIISATGRQITASGQFGGPVDVLSGLIQTDAAINPGNSGGPLINLRGQVIGVNTAIAAGANGIGFAIPINDVKPAIETVMENGKIVRPFIGIRYTQLNPQIAEDLGLPVDGGAYLVDDVEQRVPSVVPEGPADEAGLRGGDIITEIDGKKIDKDNTIVTLMREFVPGDTVNLTVVRGEETLELDVELGEFDEDTL